MITADSMKQVNRAFNESIPILGKIYDISKVYMSVQQGGYVYFHKLTTRLPKENASTVSDIETSGSKQATAKYL